MSLYPIPEAEDVLVLALAIADAVDADQLMVKEALVDKLVAAVRPVQERMLTRGIVEMLGGK